MDLIEENLYLGELTAATDRLLLSSNNISHILTVDIQPLPSSVEENTAIVCKFIEAEDHENYDLLSRFDECISFINEAVKSGNTILVHCCFGISRSATIVCAYLMRKYCWNYEEALHFIKEKREIVWPNSGFVAQLMLFAYMKWKALVTNPLYRLYLLQMFARELDEGRPVEEFSTIIANMNKETELGFKEGYKCKFCRHTVFSQEDVFVHNAGQWITWENVLDFEKNPEDPVCVISHFVQPKLWIKNDFKGKILCPHCKKKLGYYTWAGSKCPCGARMLPMFCIPQENVDCNINANNQTS